MKAMILALLVTVTWSFSFTPADRLRPTAVWGPFPDYERCQEAWVTVITTLRDAGVRGLNGEKLSWCVETVSNP